MKIEVLRCPDYPNTYDLFVDGRRVVYCETYVIVENVKDALLNKRRPFIGEIEGVADAIRKDMGEGA